MTDHIFISHASEDAAVADKIVAYLEARGVPCWIASRDIPPRAIYADAIVEGMQLTPRRTPLQHVLKRPEPAALRVHQHGHISRLVLVIEHLLVRVGDLVPGQHFAHRRVDAAVDDELVGLAGVIQVREV